jgi:FkbM family methyltransferase
VVALEPDPTNFAWLVENIAANHFANVDVVNAALADKPGSRILSGGKPGSRTIMKWHGTNDQMVNVVSIGHIMRLFSIVQIDFLKLDIEGAEFLLFEEPSWLSHVVRIAMEIHPLYGNPHEITRSLAEHGYSYSISRAYDEDTLMLYGENTMYSNHDRERNA